MIKTVGIVSLSRGVLGEEFVRHELEIGLARLHAYGLEVKFLPHALAGLDYVKQHPEKRAQDLIDAFSDDDIDLILCAVGGDDTYRLAPYLFENNALKNALKPKPFLGFSDTTLNHLMLNKLSLPTFYGQAFLSDVCEMDKEMLPYTRRCFEELITTGGIREITPAPVWYTAREDFSRDAIGARPCPCTKTAALSFCRARRAFRARYSAGAWIRFLIFSTGRATPICPQSARATACSPRRTNGAARFSCLKPARSKCPLKSTKKPCNTSKMRAYSARSAV